MNLKEEFEKGNLKKLLIPSDHGPISYKLHKSTDDTPSETRYLPTSYNDNKEIQNFVQEINNSIRHTFNERQNVYSYFFKDKYTIGIAIDPYFKNINSFTFLISDESEWINNTKSYDVEIPDSLKNGFAARTSLPEIIDFFDKIDHLNMINLSQQLRKIFSDYFKANQLLQEAAYNNWEPRDENDHVPEYDQIDPTQYLKENFFDKQSKYSIQEQNTINNILNLNQNVLPEIFLKLANCSEILEFSYDNLIKIKTKSGELEFPVPSFHHPGPFFDKEISLISSHFIFRTTNRTPMHAFNIKHLGVLEINIQNINSPLRFFRY